MECVVQGTPVYYESYGSGTPIIALHVDQVIEPFSKPTLLFLGRQDATVGYRDAWKLLENYPHATYAVLDRAGHNAHIEQSRLFDALMGEWLDRVEEAA